MTKLSFCPIFWESDPQYPNEKGIDSRWYKETLEEEVIPALLETCDIFDDLIFMLDGVPAHFFNKVYEVLDEFFSDSWMGRGTKDSWRLTNGLPRR